MTMLELSLKVRHGREQEVGDSFHCHLCPARLASAFLLKRHQLRHLKSKAWESSEEKYQDKSMAPVIKETKRSRKTLLKIIAENKSIVNEDDEVQVWDGEEYVSVPQEVDKTVILRGNERELINVEEFFNDENFGQPSPPENTMEIRQSVGFSRKTPVFQ